MPDMKWGVMALVLAACSSDPTLHVVVVHPSSVAVESTTISVYTSKTFTCEDIEYGNVDTGALDAALVAQEMLDSSGPHGALSGLSRTDDKLIVARGYDANGGLVTAGCVDKGVVSGAATVEVDTEVAAVVSIALVDPTGATDTFGIAVTVTDQGGKAIDGRQVWWRAYGPAGAPPDARAIAALTMVTDGVWEPAQPACTKKGLAVIHPVPPNLIGGYAVEVRVAWSVAPPQMFSSFTRIGLALTQVSVPTSASTKYCARHGASLVCLDNSGGTLAASTYTASVSAGVASLSKGASTAVPSDTIALYDTADGTYAATASCAVAPLFGAPGAHAASCMATPANDILYVPACGAVSAKLLFHLPGAATDSMQALDLASGQSITVTLPFSGLEDRIDFNAAGCVTELDPAGGTSTLRQTIVLDFTRDKLLPVTRALYNCSGTGCEVLSLPIAQAGVGFTGGSESRMVVTTVDATGVELSHDVLLPDSGGAAAHLVERLREPAASVPVEMVAGNFDSDDGPDLMWDVASRRGVSFEVAYARMVGAQPLAALSPVQTAIVDQMLVGDVTNDSHDDLIVLGRTIEAIPKAGVAVVPTQVQAPDPMLKPDSTCAP